MRTLIIACLLGLAACGQPTTPFVFVPNEEELAQMEPAGCQTPMTWEQCN